MKTSKRTHMCAEINQECSNVTICGWVQTRRDLGGIIFIDLRDRSGIVQIVFDEEICNNFGAAEKIRNEFVLAVTGKVVRRSEDTINEKLATGHLEVKVENFEILNTSETPPFSIEEDSDVKEQTRLKYRYLDLRRPDMQKTLMLRHKVAKMVRDFYDQNGFLEIETPMLTKSTPEGSRDYLVPSRINEGKFYALAQSPQLYKQILMLSGYDRYFQIVKCFRDEDLRADRQPEFTQIDIEMSFVDIDDIISINEKLIAKIFKEVLNLEIPIPFKRLTYREAMDRFGSDKPDTRFGFELKDISDLIEKSEFKVFADVIKRGGSVRAINAKNAADKFSRRDLDGLIDFVKIYKAKGMAWIIVEENELKSPITKYLKQEEVDSILERLEAKPNDIIMFVADQNEIVYNSLGALRIEVAKRLNLISNDLYNLLWVTEFPLFEYSQEEKTYVAKHHPFTAPMDEDIDLVETEPQNVRSKAYDIILNGVELGGGSIRICNSELQSRMFKALGLSEETANERFGFLLEAFKYGTPPHGGMAYGFDRLIMLLAGKDSLRDVIPFPKVQTASEIMTGSPSFVDEVQLKELNINLINND